MANLEIEVEEDELESLTKNAKKNVTTPAKKPQYQRNICFGLISLAIMLLLSSLLMDATEKSMNDSDPFSEKSSGGSPAKEQPPVLSADEVFPPGFKRTKADVSDTYIRRGKPISEGGLKELAQKWGSWTFVDKKREQRPVIPYEKYPNRDIPRDAFPKGSWQTDTQYLAEFLPEAIALVDRAIEAILAEYGKSKFDMPNVPQEERSRGLEVTEVRGKSDTNAGIFKGNVKAAIQRRLLHAVMTEDSFHIMTGGHSAAAGHGNHFQQSYTLQIQRALEPVLARLHVFHKSHNYGVGGMGTIQNALAAKDLYGSDIDILNWDSAMTEGDGISKDIFARQGLLSGNRVPILWGAPDGCLYSDTGIGCIDTNIWAAGFEAVEMTKDILQMETLPWASQCVNNDNSMWGECKPFTYAGVCWIDRADNFTPPVAQNREPGGRASWHPGNRFHLLRSRLTVYNVLVPLREALLKWNATDDYNIPDSEWHVTEHYQAVRDAVLAMNNTACREWSVYPDTVCDFPISGRSEFTPRFNPARSSIHSMMVLQPGDEVREEPNCYDPPDVFNPALDPPEGAVDYLHIVENGMDFSPNKARALHVDQVLRNGLLSNEHAEVSAHGIVPGRGWYLESKSAPANCDGSYESFCGRDKNNNCLLYAHNDGRGGMIFDGLSGWLVVNLENVKFGLIFIRMQDWNAPGTNPATLGWLCENNVTGCETRDLQETSGTTVERNLADPCTDYHFEFAINGEITSWSHDELQNQKIDAQRVVQLYTLLNNPEFSSGSTADVELAIRINGCGRNKVLQLSHIYWQ